MRGKARAGESQTVNDDEVPNIKKFKNALSIAFTRIRWMDWQPENKLPPATAIAGVEP